MILNRSPLVRVAQKKVSGLRQELGAVAWVWADGQGGSWANYSVNDPSETIEDIHPVFQERIRFQDVLKAYGEPSHVVAIAEHPPDSNTIYYTLWVIYLPQGFVVRSGGPIKPDLDDNTRFYEVVFFVPTRAGVENAVYAAKDHPEWVIPWQDFRGFDFYCRDSANGAHCRGGSK